MARNNNQTYNPFQDLLKGENHNMKNKKNYGNNNRNNNSSKKEEIYYLSFFLKEEDKSVKNKDKDKIKKLLVPLITFTVENKNFSKDNTHFKKDFSIIIRNKFEKLPLEYKEKFIKETNVFIRENVLEHKINNAFEDAVIFLRDLRNIMMHKNVKKDTFSRCKFNNFDGDLFNFLTLTLESEADNNIKRKNILKDNNKDLSSEKFDIKDKYIHKVLEMDANKMKQDFSNIPFIYALSVLAMFTESKYIKEVLDLIKRKKFIEEFVLSFSLRGGYKTFVPGISLENDDLYLKQLEMKDEVNKEVTNTGRRLIKKLDYFNVDKNKNVNNQFVIYQKILRFYGYRTSFPKIYELENNVREYKAKEIVQANKNKMEGIRQYNENAREYNKKNKVKLQIQVEHNDLETNYKNIIPTLTNVFRNEDIFIREAAEFLSSKYKNQFGNDTWTISGNTIIWLEPNDNIIFDTRKKVKPSKNGLNSIYKIVYNKENADRYSLNRHNLRALIASILINGGLSFADLKKTASNNNDNKGNTKPKNINTNNKSLVDDLKEKSINWNRHKQASFVVKVIRKNIIKGKHLHNRDSVAFFQEFIRALYILDNRTGNVYDDILDIIKKYGIDSDSMSEDVKNILKADTLKEMLNRSFGIFKSSKKSKGNGNNLAFKTWPKFAFLPYNKKNESIYNLLQWDKVREKYPIKNSADLFDILCSVFNKNNITLPPIVDLYNDYVKNNKVDKYRNKEIRNIVAEEILLSYISLNYMSLINKDEKSYFELESYVDNNDNSPLKFNLVWNLNPVIRISIRDYMKKDIRSALNWVFDSARIKEKGKINNKEDLQQCLTNAIKSYKLITSNNILKYKCPKPTSEMKNDVLNADNIKDIVKVLIWAQKELLYFICNMEADIIFTLYQIYTEAQIDELVKEEGYFNFRDLVNLHNENIDKIKLIDNHKDNSVLDGRIIDVRNMLAHGRLFDKKSNIDYSKIISILDDSTKKTIQKSLEKFYSNKNTNTRNGKNYRR